MPEPRKLFVCATKLAGLSSRERWFLVRAWVLAPIAVASLRTWGLRRVLGMLENRSFEPRGAPVDVVRGEQLVRAAFRYGLASGSCLPESLVQYALHLGTGPTPRFVVGVRKDARGDVASVLAGIGAHAWIEEEGGMRREPGFSPILWLTPNGLSSAADDLQ